MHDVGQNSLSQEHANMGRACGMLNHEAVAIADVAMRQSACIMQTFGN